MSDSVLASLNQLLGEKGVRREADDFLPEIILKPQSTEQVSGILKIWPGAFTNLATNWACLCFRNGLNNDSLRRIRA